MAFKSAALDGKHVMRAVFAMQVLLERTWCVLRADAPPLRDGFSLSQAAGQHQVRLLQPLLLP